jgi:hypothetical protein
MTLTYESVCKSDPATLERLLEQGEAPRLESLAGWEFRGFNVIPLLDAVPLAELAGMRKFKKGFFWDPANDARLMGYNVKVEQNGLLKPWQEKLKDGRPLRHAYYEVYPVRPAERDNRYPNSLLLDYGSMDHAPWDPSALLRDYLVRLSTESEDLLLGKAYGALGAARLPLSYFVLERYNQARG